MTGDYYRNKIETIRLNMMRGFITYDEAKQQAQPIIDEMNKRGSEISKKYGRKFKGFTFSALMR